MEKKYELIKFEDGDFSLDVNVSPIEDTVWLTKEQISTLFDRDRSVISKHIKNILSEKECDNSNVQKMHIANSDKPVDESLNGWIKEELFLDFDLGHSNNVEELIKEYVNYYNNERPAYSLKYKTPAQFISELGFN